MNFVKKHPLLTAFLIPFFICIIICIGNGVYPFGDYCLLHMDLYHQYLPFFNELWEKLRNGASLMYTWNIGLGSDFVSVFAYYLASPLNWLVVFFPKSHIIEFIELLIIFKISLSGATFFYFLKEHFVLLGKDNRYHDNTFVPAFVFSTAYALSGFVAAYSWDVMWMDVVAVAPLAIVGLEKLVRDKKPVLYYVSLALCILSNYYLSIMLCIFLVFWFAWLFFTQKGGKMAAIVRFAVYSLLAGGTAMVLIIPELIILSYSGSSGIEFPKQIEWYFNLLSEDYNKQNVEDVEQKVNSQKQITTVDGKSGPNIICVLLESFCDPDEINFLQVNEDPIPTFHELEKNYSSGYLNVPVVGAGTANTEFEMLTGLSMQYFGTGEYPYKTILKQTDCESIASDLSKIGYATHVVHNNGGNFYSRTNAFSKMGFDTFTSKELMNITEYTPNGSWPTDDILVSETMKTFDATPNQSDFTYIITVGTHGDYPKEPVIENPTYTVSGVEDEGMKNAWTYYVNQLNEADRFIKELTDELSKRDEDTIVVMFGDHLPTMGLQDSDMKSGDIYKTKYITWNNMGLPKEDADLYAYQLLAQTTDTVGIHEGTIMNYHQTQMNSTDEASYQDGLDLLQYDILYGKRYCYNGTDLYPASDLVMGIDKVDITNVSDSSTGDTVYIYGHNFTNWSKVYINDSKVASTYLSAGVLAIRKEDISDGDEITVCQVGSSDTIFRKSENTYTYVDPAVEHDSESETDEPTENQ